MAELTPQERLQPALLDRLADDDPTRATEPREMRVMSKARLREAVLRDLAWLFNSTRMSETIDWPLFPFAERSVINFGLPALSGTTASTLDVERQVRQTLVDYEPRIMPSTLQVEAIVSDLQMDHHNVVSLKISGHLWAQPVPFELLLRTEVDLETGQVEIHDITR